WTRLQSKKQARPLEDTGPRLRNRLMEPLVDAHVARAGFDAHSGAAAVDLSGDMVAIKRTLHGHLMIGMYRTGPGGCIEHKAGIAGREFDTSRAGLKAPVTGGRAADLDVAGAGAR